jgi:predicted outer membrane repeat protein
MKTKNFLLSILFAAFAFSANATIYYITPAGSGTMTGLSWATARSAAQLQNTINAAVLGDEVWVAAGTYKPTQTSANSTTPTDVREKCFVMKAGVKILGGFPSTGIPTLALRKPFVNKTILTGELQNDANLTNNCYNVVRNYRNSLTYTAILDGFWITNGAGGAAINGSGMLIDNCSPAIFNCVFSENTSKNGGAISVANNAVPKFITCIFMNNTATSKGGAIMVNAASPIFANSLLFNNKATQGGGVLFCTTTGQATFHVCDIHGNSSASFAAFMYTEGANNNFTLCNSIVWNNVGNGFVYDDGMASTRLVKNSVYPLNTGSSFYNISADPRYTAELDPDGVDNIFGTEDDGLRLSSDSPAVGLGDTLLIPQAIKADIIKTDIAGSPRISGVKIDAGAYEYQQRVVRTEDVTQTQAVVQIYPNPAQDFIYISSEAVFQNANFVLYTSTGSQILHNNFTAFANDVTTISLSDLPQGIYFYQIIADDKRYTGKIVLQR